LEKVIFDGEVLNYFDELVFTLFKKEYFSFPENAKKYVDTIVGFVTAEIFTFPPKKNSKIFTIFREQLHFLQIQSKNDLVYFL